ncbi:Trihelix transcription factor GT-4 [Frankliniella fusca]|uniref:Trihelix transcription factor GT-4 n=1 Tax=Frankliniella fusca TaxID=407009 RepID=A0AAE1HAK8_9NEOP|nr:Trihelix transcription factor GT-4 [Frankliniella fusca]
MAKLKGNPLAFGRRRKSSPCKVISTAVKKQPDPQRVKGPKFNDAATLLLIALRKELDPKFDSSAHRNAALWECIAKKKMSEKGYSYVGKQCEAKMVRLMDQYKLYEESAKVTGNNCRKFDYVEEMRDFMGKLVTVNPLN